MYKNTKNFCGEVILKNEDLSECCNKYPIELNYYKTCTKKSNIIKEEYEVYGIEIIKKEYMGNRIHTESMCVNNITKNEKTLDKVVKILKDNTVTPVTLNDVINDMFKK